MTTKTRITAAVISLVVLAVALSARGEPKADDHAKRRAAFAWATRQQQMALIAIFPPAGRNDPLPVCRVVTIRPSSVSADRREFLILIKEDCDHKILSAVVRVTHTPLTIQLAEMKYEDSNLNLESALPRLKFDQRQLSVQHARRILQLLDRVRFTATPLQAFVLDQPGIELSIAAWGEIRVVTFLPDTRRHWKRLNAALVEALRLSDLDFEQLRFDMSGIEQ